MADDPHYISPQDAAVLTSRWRKEMPDGAFHGARFDRIAFDNLLSQPGCAGIRIYMGMELPGAKDTPSRWTYVLVGTDAKGNDMVARGSAMADGDSAEGDGGGTEEWPLPCPPLCDVSSPLNSDSPA